MVDPLCCRRQNLAEHWLSNIDHHWMSMSERQVAGLVAEDWQSASLAKSAKKLSISAKEILTRV